MPRSERLYFAARPVQDIGRALMDRLRPLLENGQVPVRDDMANAYSHIYGVDVGYGTPSGVIRGGERGELAMLRIPASPAYLRQKHAMITSAKVVWKTQAKNGTSGAAECTSLGNDILEDQWKSNGMGPSFDWWLMLAMGFGAAFAFHEWNRSLGPALMALGDRRIPMGDVEHHVVPQWDVWFDDAAPSYKAVQSRWVRLYKNKFDLAKDIRVLPDGRKGEEVAEVILNACDKTMGDGINAADRDYLKNSDLVPVWYFFHDASAALPLGRHTMLLGEEVLRDEPLKGPNATYEGCPVHRIADQDIVGTPYARAVFWDTLGGQEISDGIDTTMATRATTMGKPIIAYEQGSDFSPERIGQGFNGWKYPRGAKPPEEISMMKMPMEFLEYRRDVQAQNQAIIGTNDIMRGQAPSAQMNAQAFAVLASMSLQQAAPQQTAFTTGISGYGTGLLKMLAKKITKPRSLRFSKDTTQPVSYTGKQLVNVEGVSVEVGNPMEQTAAGRKVILDDKMAAGWVVNEAAYDQVLATGRSEPTSRANINEMTLIQWEYEQLAKGINPPVSHSHNHKLHYRENYSAANTASAAGDAKVLAAAEAHAEAHYALQFGVPRQGDPLAFIRERWLMGQEIGPGQEMAPPMPGAPPGAPPGGPPPGPGAEAEAAMAPPGAPVAPAPLPELPENPLTGEQLAVPNA